MGETTLKKIADGVTLCTVRTDRFKTCRISVLMALPLAGDIAAAAVLPYILRRSCRKYPDFTSLNGRLDMLYGAVLSAAVTKKGEAQILRLSVNAIDDRFALGTESTAQEAAKLLLDLLFDPKLENGTFPADDVETEKRLLLERMRSEDDDKRRYAMRRCEEEMFSQEAFGRNRYGTEEEIVSLTPERVYAAWRRVLRTAVIRVMLVTSGSDETIRDILTEQFSGTARQPIVPETQFLPVPTGDVRHAREAQPLQQGTLVLGFRCGMRQRDDMDPAMLVMNDMFGGGTSSKLFTVVREKMSLTYYCHSVFNRDKGVMFVFGGIKTENEQKTKDAILEQLSQMQQGAFTKEDFDASVRSLADSIRGYTDSPEVLCFWYGGQLLQDKLLTIADRIAQIESVRFEDIQKAAQQVRLDTIFMLEGTEADHHA